MRLTAGPFDRLDRVDQRAGRGAQHDDEMVLLFPPT
jgi:hypothetical protein